MRGGVRMCRENTQKPQIPHCRCRWKDPTKPNHFISPNSLSYCGMPLRRWVLRCHTTNWESQQAPFVWPTPLVVYSYCNHHNNLAPRNIKWWHGSCRNLHCTLWSGRFKQSELSVCERREGCNVLSCLVCQSLLLLSKHPYCHYYFGYKTNKAIKITR